MTEHLPAPRLATRRLIEDVMDDAPALSSDGADRLVADLLGRLAAHPEGIPSGVPTDDPGDNYRRLLREALSAAAEARGELALKTREAERLRRLSITDEATGVLNRRGFDGALQRALSRLERTGETGLLLVIDLNDFKTINDENGHCAGDLVLASVATLLSRQTRATDAVARLGGDEFAVILGGADPVAGRIKASRLETLLNSLRVDWAGQTIAVSASVGVVDYAGGDMADEIVQRADLDMYHKKRLTAAGTPAAANRSARRSDLIEVSHS